MNKAKVLGQAYLTALEAGDLDRILALFAPGATVISPLYGAQPAPAFFARLLADTRSSELSLTQVYTGVAATRQIALLFDYRWHLTSGETLLFSVVDIMTLDGAGKISTLQIFYDASAARAALGDSH